MHHPLMARSFQKTIPERMKDALRRVEGAFSIVAMTRTKLIGVRDPLGVRPLVLGRLGDGWVLSSETCALDIIGAEFMREIEPGEMVVIDAGRESVRPSSARAPRFCIFEQVYFSRPDSILGGRSVYETRRQIGVELAREAPVEADLVCPVPDSGTPAAIGYSQESGIPFAMGITRNQYMGRTFIEPSRADPQHGRAAEAERQPRAGRGQADRAGRRQRGARHHQPEDQGNDPRGGRAPRCISASPRPPTAWPCFYGVDTPERSKLLAARMTEDEMRDHHRRGQLKFISLDGLYRAAGEAGGPQPACPQYCDACFSGEYPVAPRHDRARVRCRRRRRRWPSAPASGRRTAGARAPAGRGPGTAARTGTSAYRAALFDPRAGTVQPLAYALGLARAALRAGVRRSMRPAR
jgi:amidophosphoribosyltransferase